jgi:FeS assembly SUF system protein
VTNPDEGSGQQAEPRTGESPAAEGAETIRSRVVDVLRTVYDPEIPVDIYELGLIYEIEVREGGAVFLRMTLTSPMCPVAESLPPEVEAKVRGVPGVKDVELELVWEPPWNPSMMSEAARLELGM